jgi:hypothetical protein
LERKEKEFAKAKNLLDIEYQENLTYMQIIVITIATVTVSMDIFFLTNKDMDSLRLITGYGLILITISVLYFRKALRKVKQQIQNLS